ncbi:MAG: cyclic nucleotide-binding domain-containing protein [Chloroflexota bacterium]
MKQMTMVELLKRVQLFSGLGDDELQQVVSICHEVNINPNTVFIEQNTTGSEMYIIAEGTVDVFIHGLNNSRSLVILGQGQVVGEMALIDQGYRSASVRSTKNGAHLFKIERDTFQSLCNDNTLIGFVVMRNMALDLAFKLRHRNLAEL